jgi:hypothetical protein
MIPPSPTTLTIYHSKQIFLPNRIFSPSLPLPDSSLQEISSFQVSDKPFYIVLRFVIMQINALNQGYQHAERGHHAAHDSIILFQNICIIMLSSSLRKVANLVIKVNGM